MEMWTILIFLTVFIFTIWKLTSKKPRLDLDRIPGPGGYPLIGRAFTLMGKPLHEVFRKWSIKYGPIIHYKVLHRDVIVLSDYTALQEGLMTRGKDYADRVFDENSKRMRSLGRGVIIGNYNPRWRAQRKGVHQALKLYGSGLSTFEEQLNVAMDNIVTMFSDTRGQPFDPFEHIYSVIATFIATLLSRKQHHHTDPFVKFAKGLEERPRGRGGCSPARSLLFNAFPILRRIPPFRSLSKQIEDQHKTLLQEHIIPMMNTDEFKEGKGILAELEKMKEAFRDKKQNETDEMTDRDVMSVSRDLVVAGTVTTTTTIYVFISLMIHYPDVQRRLASEVNSVLEDGKVKVSLSHKEHMPYMRAAILEVLRYSTVVPLAIPHQTRVDTELCGYKIPAGVVVFMNLWAHHHSEKEWEDPWSFKPERFLDAEGNLVDADHRMRRKLIPFGAGPRLCLGELLAMNRIFLLLVNLIQHFEFLPPDGERLVTCDARVYVYGMVLTPPSYKVRAIPKKMLNDKV